MLPKGWFGHILVLLFLLSDVSGRLLGVTIYSDTFKLHRPIELVSVIQAYRVQQVHLLGVDPEMLNSLANTGIEVIVRITNEQLLQIGESQAEARSWINTNIVPFTPATNITYVMASNGDLSSNTEVAARLLPAIQNLHSALTTASLHDRIKISTLQSVEMIPKPKWHSIMPQLLQFLNKTGSSLFLYTETDGPLLHLINSNKQIGDIPLVVMQPVGAVEANADIVDGGLVYYRYITHDPVDVAHNDDVGEGLRRSLVSIKDSSGLVGVFCVAISNADPTALTEGLNWACGPGSANCAPIQPGGSCYVQNNLAALASYAYNDYYHRTEATGGTCNFNGTASLTNTDPSYGSCIYAGSTLASTNSTVVPTRSPPPSSSTSPTTNFTDTFGPISPGEGASLQILKMMYLVPLIVLNFFLDM